MLERRLDHIPLAGNEKARSLAGAAADFPLSVPALEWRTLILWAVIHGFFAVVTFWHETLPLWLLPLVGAPLVAWHASYQHEAIHGHPTRIGWLNAALAGLPLMLWLPYGIYRDSHLKHHRNEYLTDPIEDPESFYVTPDEWAGFSPPRRWLHAVVNTLAGRLLLGPLFVSGLFLAKECRAVRSGGFRWKDWGLHGIGAGLVLSWVLVVCGMPLWVYIACFAYPGTGLLLLRSFAEHHAAPEPEDRTAIVEAEKPLALLFLNNNLHVAHHARPGLPWYDLPRYEAVRRANETGPGRYVYRGYREIARLWLFRRKESPVHPHC